MSGKEIDRVRRRIWPGCCDIKDEEGKIMVRIEMPGVPKDNLDVKIEGDKLIIHGRKETSETGGTFLLREIREGDYHQEFTIDDTIDGTPLKLRLKTVSFILPWGSKSPRSRER